MPDDSRTDAPLMAGIEAGGTKFVCGLGYGPGRVVAETSFPTTTPDETLGRAIAFFREAFAAHGRPAAIGVAAFGPVDLHPGSDTWGHVTSTPKPHWQGADMAGPIGRALDLPVAFETDVNGAAFGEGLWGAGRGLGTFVYVTIGTGVGGGIIVNRQILRGLVHPEVGHMTFARESDDTGFDGICPYHGDCLEGLASGPALARRWGVEGKDLDEGHEAWTLQARYLARMCTNLTLVLSPERIILGGGVMKQAHLFPRVREATKAMLNGYVDSPDILDRVDRFIVPPALGDHAGLMGAMALGQARAEGQTRFHLPETRA
ncbi:ROK family protein [Yunchengibacter salinarum]|uniref:ROK family protein n=1 Tax=Yunchengibacter salinarum TaxID=3133399 RepID=UPI0035B619AF